MSYETELQQNNLDLQSLIEKANSLPSSSEVLAQANAYADNPTVADLTGLMVCTPNTNCGSTTIISAYKVGRMISFNIRLTPIANSAFSNGRLNISTYFHFTDENGDRKTALEPLQNLFGATVYSDHIISTRLIQATDTEEPIVSLRLFEIFGSAPNSTSEINVSFTYICQGE